MASGLLSGGQQQMLVIGRAMMAEPDLIMLDEPTLGLSPLLVNEVFGILERLKQHGHTILLCEQNANKAFAGGHPRICAGKRQRMFNWQWSGAVSQ